MIDIKIFQKRKPLPAGEFVERNPNLSYLVNLGGDSKESCLIDAALDIEQLRNELEKTRSSLKSILLTHVHGDHIAELQDILEIYPSINIYVHSRAEEYLKSIGFQNVVPLRNNQVVCIGALDIIALNTPGHSNNSVSYWQPEYNVLFSGDTIFGGGIGCCDYRGGGNRNIFYLTLQNLLEMLPPETNIYPGHFSEHYQSKPPYRLSEEYERNPYLKSVIQGRRGDFDRALKRFSIDFEMDNHVLLDESDIDRICDLERETWIPELQASRENILKRLRSGHKMLAVRDKDRLLGMVCWRYDSFALGDELNKFPGDFAEFSLKESAPKPEARSAFIYNLGVSASARQRGLGSALLQWAYENIRSDGVQQVFVDSRIPAYYGSRYKDIENVAQMPEFTDSINSYLSSNIVPAEDRLSIDPTLRFYMVNGFKPWLVIDEFIQDQSSGNLRIICYINLEQDEDAELRLYRHDSA
jgi:hydroxyacylglutathione hydrolase